LSPRRVLVFSLVALKLDLRDIDLHFGQLKTFLLLML
jgi:hypothetical protein